MNGGEEPVKNGQEDSGGEKELVVEMLKDEAQKEDVQEDFKWQDVLGSKRLLTKVGGLTHPVHL